MKKRQPKEKARETRPPFEQIALHAEMLWRQRGCPQGQDKEIWLEAERRLSEENRRIDLGVSRQPWTT